MQLALTLAKWPYIILHDQLLSENLSSPAEEKQQEQVSMSTNANVSSTRQRATLACDVCRSRRTKCDGLKPSCSFCEAHGILCNYRSAAPLAPSRSVKQQFSWKHVELNLPQD
jgi:hypothetical protein